MIRHRLHQVLYRHVYLTRGGAAILVCHRRLSRRSSVFFRPWAGALWEESENVEDLLRRAREVR